MIVGVARKITSLFIKMQVIKEDDYDTYEYCFQVLLLNILNFGTVILIALIIDRFVETLFYIAGFFVLRKQAGGYHAGSAKFCYFLSIMFYLVFLIAVKFVPDLCVYDMALVLSVLSFIIIWLFSPVEDKNKPFSKAEFSKFKKNSRIVITIFFIGYILTYWLQLYNIRLMVLSLCLGNFLAAASLIIAKIKNRNLKCSSTPNTSNRIPHTSKPL